MYCNALVSFIIKSEFLSCQIYCEVVVVSA
jgi:hypothetical protein